MMGSYLAYIIMSLTLLRFSQQHHLLLLVIGSRKITRLCLFDLSSAFNTIDRNILLVCPLGLAFTALH